MFSVSHLHASETRASRPGLFSLISVGMALCFFPLLNGCREKNEPTLSGRDTLFVAIEKIYLENLSGSTQALDSLKSVLESLEGNPQASSGKAREDVGKYFLAAKHYFKMAEPVLAFVERENYQYLNAPNLLKVEEEDRTNIKELKPSGFQVLEETLFADTLDAAESLNQVRMTRNRLHLIRSNAKITSFSDYHFLWMVREALLRVAFIGLTGFDSPVLENSLNEAQSVYQSLHAMMKNHSPKFRDKALHGAWLSELDSARIALQGGFAGFDRYDFIRRHTHAQIGLWNKTVADWRVEFPLESALKNKFASPFSREAFNLAFFSDPQSPPATPEKVALGKRLFHDTRLSSADKNMSCASCHLESRGFADNNRTSFGLPRNTPTLAYAALQQAFFFDGRAGSLEGQIVSVVEAELEFHTNLRDMRRAIADDSGYAKTFAAIYRDTVTEANIRNALADYVRSLAPFDSKFDRNMRGEESSLTPGEIHGFNLFMGKGKCATCHFPPAFNGTVPPAYTDTEFEHLGVPATPAVQGAEISPDLGRFHYFGADSRKHFFKTPTLRNAEKTAPYMHNGVYDSLAQVVDFYNRGGGIGIGITGPETEFQTLPPDPLDLSPQEMADLVAFMKTLNDAGY